MRKLEATQQLVKVVKCQISTTVATQSRMALRNKKFPKQFYIAKLLSVSHHNIEGRLIMKN